MAKAKSAEPLKLVTLNVFERDYERLEEIFPTVGKQVAIRSIIRKFIEDYERDHQQ